MNFSCGLEHCWAISKPLGWPCVKVMPGSRRGSHGRHEEGWDCSSLSTYAANICSWWFFRKKWNIWKQRIVYLSLEETVQLCGGSGKKPSLFPHVPWQGEGCLGAAGCWLLLALTTLWSARLAWGLPSCSTVKAQMFVVWRFLHVETTLLETLWGAEGRAVIVLYTCLYLFSLRFGEPSPQWISNGIFHMSSGTCVLKACLMEGDRLSHTFHLSQVNKLKSSVDSWEPGTLTGLYGHRTQLWMTLCRDTWAHKGICTHLCRCISLQPRPQQNHSSQWTWTVVLGSQSCHLGNGAQEASAGLGLCCPYVCPRGKQAWVRGGSGSSELHACNPVMVAFAMGV